jgi:hypothetical protein
MNSGCPSLADRLEGISKEKKYFRTFIRNVIGWLGGRISYQGA